MAHNIIVNAVYNDSKNIQYKGNPLIEALPPILNERQVGKALSSQVELHHSEIYQDAHIRRHNITQLNNNFFQPLSRHIELESKLSIMLRQGYIGRNLANGNLNAHIQNGYERVIKGDLDVFRFEHAKSTAKSLSFIGCSGSGKTSSIEQILEMYPQVIFHKQYNFTQIVFLKIDCPHDGTLKSLCHNFFRAIDAVISGNYVQKYVQKRHSVETLISEMAHIANHYAIGLLVIDEIQHLNTETSGAAERMLNFFVTLVNTISIPVVMVGTPKASPIFELDFRSARRASGFGSIFWDPIKNPLFEKDISRNDWAAFTKRLWKYQWLRKADPEISDEIRDIWYDLSQGIMDIVIKLFVLSQIRAMDARIERITPNVMKTVYEDAFKPIHKMIDALRSGKADRIAKYSDLTIPGINDLIMELDKYVYSQKEDSVDEPSFDGNKKAAYLYDFLVGLGYESDLLEQYIKRAFKENPTLKVEELIPIVTNWYQEAEGEKTKKTSNEVRIIPESEWHTLDSSDPCFLYSQASDEKDYFNLLDKNGYFFDSDSWIKSFGS